MIKIFVTGDNHIGRKYVSHERSEELASRRITAFEGMVEKANDENCDLFVITGDMFDNTYDITKKTVTAVFDILSGFQGHVIVLPGNHDFYDPSRDLWRYFDDVAAKYGNVLLLNEYRPYELSVKGQDVVFYPAFCQTLHSKPDENNLGWIKEADIPSDGKFRILAAHGAFERETIDNEGSYFLMTRAELEALPMDVCLLGHTHVPFPRGLTEEFAPCDKILNPGAHVQTDVHNNTEGLCFIVKLDDDKTVSAKRFVSGNVRFIRKEVELRQDEMKEIIERELSAIDDNSVVELKLSGTVTPEEYEEREAFLDKALARFIEGSYSDHALTKLITEEQINAEFSQTSFSAKLLSALMGDSKEVQLTYELLKTLKEGK